MKLVRCPDWGTQVVFDLGVGRVYFRGAEFTSGGQSLLQGGRVTSGGQRLLQGGRVYFRGAGLLQGGRVLYPFPMKIRGLPPSTFPYLPISHLKTSPSINLVTEKLHVYMNSGL